MSEAYRTGKLTREQATKILIDNGWAASTPVAPSGQAPRCLASVPPGGASLFAGSVALRYLSNFSTVIRKLATEIGLSKYASQPA